MDLVYEACRILKSVLQARAPYDTGNLAMNSIRIDQNRGRVIVGGEIADYAVYTNEPWMSDKWNGKQNPNEGWINKSIEEAVPIIQRVLSGRASEKEVNDILTKYKDIRAERKAQYLEYLRRIKEKQEKR